MSATPKDANTIADEVITENYVPWQNEPASGWEAGMEEETPIDVLEQAIADHAMDTDTIRTLIIAGIEADRAQRLAEAPEQDTLERALWRVDTVLAEFYDGETEEPVQALGDLMTDILHWCDYHERSLSGAEDRATQMVEWERADWGLPRIWSSDRMFRKTGPLVRQRRSER